MQQSAQAFRQGDFPRALQLCKALLREIGPNGDLLNLRAAAEMRLGRPEAAELSLAKAIRLEPERAGLYANAARVNSQLGRHRTAMRYAREAQRLAPDEAPILVDMAMVLREAGDDASARQLVERCLEIDPEQPEALFLSGLYSSEAGERDEARRTLGRLVSLQPSDALALALLVNLEQEADPDPTIVERLERIAQSDAPDEERVVALFALASVHKREARHEPAFETARRANELAARRRPFNIAYYRSKLDQIREDAEGALASLPSGDEQSERLVFIIGMPRTGTTLVEQMISAHPEVLGCGELGAMESLESDLEKRGLNPYAVEGTRAPGEELMERCRSRYLESLPAGYADHARVVDKAPNNYQRAGLIRRLFPGARFIYCARHPLDVILSAYFQHFQRGSHYSYSLESLAQVYVIHQEIMQEWFRLMPERLHRVNYAELVDRPGRHARALAQFLDLEYHPSMSKPHKNPRTVKTASRWQVRRPVYKSAVDTWRHYRAQLEPAIGILREAGILDGELRARAPRRN